MFYTGIFPNLRHACSKWPAEIVQSIKTTNMKKFLTTAFAAMTLILAIPTESYAQTNTQPYIDIKTTVEREVTPDELYLQINISEKEYKGKKTLEEMQETMLGVLKTNHIDIQECLTINYMGSEISYKTFSKNMKPKSEATYLLKLNDAATMQNVIVSLEEHQISDIELISTKYTKEKELKAEMGVEAMQKAKAEAQILAGAIDQEVGKAISISYWMDSGQSQPRLHKSAYVLEEVCIVDNSVMQPVISIGKNTYRFTVNVRFELK